MFKNIKKFYGLLILIFFISLEGRDRIIGFTGGPGVGKSSVIQELQKRGFQVIPETFTTLYHKAKQEGVLQELFSDPSRLRLALMNAQIIAEDSRDKSKFTFLDETALGVLFFGQWFKVQMLENLYEIAQNRRYDLIFIFEPLPKKLYEQTNVRQESYKESEEIHNFLKKKYTETGLITINVPFAPVQQRTDFIIETLQQQYQYADIISKIINCFAGRNSAYPIQEFLGPIKLIEVASKDPKKPYRFFGVHKDKQGSVNFGAFKRKLTKLMNVKNNGAIQIIGDSNQFSKEGTEYARAFLRPRFERAGLIEYGFTGYKTAYKSDVNTLVNEFANKHHNQADRILANIVGQTTIAIDQWGTSGSPYVKNFVVVYNEAGVDQAPKYDSNFVKISGFTAFGDDIIMSDYIFSAHENDRFICLEGGAQSFKQCTNALKQRIPVILLYNLRKPENEKFFSAARFFKLINDKYNYGKEPSKAQVQEIYDAYVKTLESLWDARRPDYETKKALFEKAIYEFIQEGIYEQIPNLCSFYDAKN